MTHAFEPDLDLDSLDQGCPNSVLVGRNPAQVFCPTRYTTLSPGIPLFLVKGIVCLITALRD